MGELQINDIQFADEGAIVQYIEVPDDIRVKGQVIKSHALQISAAHPDYREDIEALHTRAVRMLRNVLEDFNDSEPHVPAKDDDEEDRGMGE